jgi:hypothetical protein
MDSVPFSAYFQFIHPTDADALALTCRMYRQLVDDEYKRSGRNAVLPGGCWHHSLSKSARASVSRSCPNFMPKALASLVDSTCIVCKRPTDTWRVSVWGFIADAECIRHMLLNVYYIPKRFGLDPEDYQSIPRQELKGLFGKYDVVFQQRRRRLVPQEWTLQHVATVLYVHKVREYQSNQRKARDDAIAAKAAKHHKRLALDQRRTEAVAKRRVALEAHPRFAIVQRAVHVVGKGILGSYLDHVMTPKTSLRQVVANAEKIDTDGLAHSSEKKRRRSGSDDNAVQPTPPSD